MIGLANNIDKIIQELATRMGALQGELQKLDPKEEDYLKIREEVQK